MIAADHPLDALRARLDSAVRHTSELGEDLAGIPDAVAAVLPACPRRDRERRTGRRV